MSRIENSIDCDVCNDREVKVWAAETFHIETMCICKKCLKKGLKKFEEDKECEVDKLLEKIAYLKGGYETLWRVQYGADEIGGYKRPDGCEPRSGT